MVAVDWDISIPFWLPWAMLAFVILLLLTIALAFWLPRRPLK
jgi:hypothetical protein